MKKIRKKFPWRFNISTKRKKKWLILAIFLFFLGIIATLIVYLTHKPTIKNLEQIAENTLAQCEGKKYRQGCYENLVPKLMDAPTNLSIQDTFKVVAIIQNKDTSYTYCHVLGHKLSQKEVRKDPSKWKEVITKCPVNACANGCIHGVFMEKFKTERFTDIQINQLSKDLKTLCEKNTIWSPASLETYGCFHALGHAVMYLTNADVRKSLNFCRTVGDRGTRFMTYFYSCYEGTFMQIFQPLELDDASLVRNLRQTKNTIFPFCARFTGLANTACLEQSWPLFYNQLKQSPQNLDKFCDHFEPQFKKFCYGAVINILTSNTRLDVDFLYSYCSHFTSSKPGGCLGQSAGRMVTINIENKAKALTLCRKGEKVDPDGMCYQRLIDSAYSTFRKPQAEARSFCASFPSLWQRKCLKKI